MSSAPMGVSYEREAALSGSQSRQVRYFVLGLLLLVATALVWPLLGRGLSDFHFMPHVTCYLGNSTLITTHLIADLLIGFSYVVISCTLVYLVRSSKGGIPFHWMFLAFGTFIIACGGTHFMEAITLWHPIYWTSAYVKVITAVASVATAIALPVAIPNVLKNVEAVQVSAAREIQLTKANEELSAANERLQELDQLRRRFVAQASADFGDWEWDIPTGRVRWSPEVERMHGLARGTFGGTLAAWKQSVHPEDREKASAAALAAVANHSEFDLEYRALRPDGNIAWMAVRGVAEYDSSGEPLRMVGMCVDITKRKLTEQALRKSEKLAAAGRLAATIAHEINNPLEAVTNLLYLARSDRSAENYKELLELADRELQRVSHITHQTLGFYRQSSSPGMVDVVEVLTGILDIFRGKLNSRGIQTSLESDSPVLISGVSGELRQVFSNLVSNAIDASPAQSTIRIRIKQSSHFAQVTIADQGSGISPEARAQIFEPFFTTKKDVGTGLGLWISRKIVDSHGGTILFRSSRQAGSTGTVFVVRLAKVSAAREPAT